MSHLSSLTYAELRRLGWRYESVERRVFRQLRDLCGCVDVIAYDPKNDQRYAIQSTDGSDHAKRRTKALTIERKPHELRLTDLIGPMWRFEVWSWKRRPIGRLTAKRYKNGKQKPDRRKVWTLRREWVDLWTLREEEITLEMLP